MGDGCLAVFVDGYVAAFVELEPGRIQHEGIRARSQGDDGEIGLENKVLPFDGTRTAAAGSVRLAQFHALKFHA